MLAAALVMGLAPMSLSAQTIDKKCNGNCGKDCAKICNMKCDKACNNAAPMVCEGVEQAGKADNPLSSKVGTVCDKTDKVGGKADKFGGVPGKAVPGKARKTLPGKIDKLEDKVDQQFGKKK